MSASPRAVGPGSQFTILNSQFLLAFMMLLIGTLAWAATPTPVTTRTPTPRPRLSGGFGRPAASPIASESAGQSLSDVVHAAEESKARKEQKSGVAITNESLVTDPRKGKITTSSPRNVPPPTVQKPSESSASALSPTSANGAEAEWRGRAQSARSRVQELKQRVGQLEGEAKKLESDFYAWDDGSYRDGVIKPAWERKKEELETAKKDLTQAESDLADLPEKARKAGALPGWLRE
jgi:hypothetical protein